MISLECSPYSQSLISSFVYNQVESLMFVLNGLSDAGLRIWQSDDLLWWASMGDSITPCGSDKLGSALRLVFEDELLDPLFPPGFFDS